MALNPNGKSDQQSVLRQIDELNRMSIDQLRKRWQDLIGTDPGRLSRNYLIRRLAYRIQELVYGGLSRDARQKLAAIADGDKSNRRRRRANARRRIYSPARDCCATGTASDTRSSSRKTAFCTTAKSIAASAPWPARSRARIGVATASSASRPTLRRKGVGHKRQTTHQDPLCGLHAQESRRGPRSGIQFARRSAHRRAKPTSSPNAMKAGNACPNATTTAVFPAARWIGRRSTSCSTTFAPGGSTV